MYDIGLPEIQITSRAVSEDDRAILYEAEAIKRPSKCNNASCLHIIKPHIHSSKINSLRDIKSEGKLVFINLKISRYRCPDCNYVFPDEFTFFSKNSHITNRLKDEFVKRVIKGETFSYIANDYGIDHKTVASAFKAYSETHKELLTYDYTPEVLGVDEAHIDDHYRLVVTDIKEQRLLDMKRDNKASIVKSYLKTLDKMICKYITMGFAPSYARCVKDVLPDSLVVIDKFHAVQEVNRCLDRTRIFLQNYYHRECGVDTRRFKRAKYLFMTNWEDLTEDETDRLNDWFNDFPDLYTAYMTKEIFRDIYSTAETKEEADEMFDKWLKTIPLYDTFAPMRKTMTRRREHILNYWDAPYTNAYTESVNNLIKKIEKGGRGYKFDTLRERCMLEINAKKPDKFDPKTAIFICSDGSKKSFSDKAKKLYKAPEPKPIIKKDTVSFGMITNFNNFGGKMMRTPDYNILKDSISLYLEVFNQEKYKDSTINRLKAYYKAIRDLYK